VKYAIPRSLINITGSGKGIPKNSNNSGLPKSKGIAQKTAVTIILTIRIFFILKIYSGEGHFSLLYISI